MREYEDWIAEEEAAAAAADEASAPMKTWLVPEVYGMGRLLEDRFRDEILRRMNEYLVRGELSALLREPVVSERITSPQLRPGRIDYWRLNRTDFLADVGLTARLTLDRQGRDVVEDRAFCLTLWFNTDEGFRFEAQEISREEDRPERAFRRLDDHLVPILNRDETEADAEQLWETLLPGAVTPAERTAEALASALGLSVRSLRLAGEAGTKAALFFRDGQVLVQPDKERGAEGVPPPVPVPVAAGTIVLNTAVRHPEGASLDVLHECVHYEWHLLFYRLQRLASTRAEEIPCRRVQNSTGRPPRNPLRWIEKHAREGALALLLPRSRILERARRLYQEASAWPLANGYLNHDGFRWDRVVDGILNEYSASAHGVCRSTVRRRLVSLGITAARGAANYVDGRWITPFAFAPEHSEQRNDTYVIRRREMMDLYRRDPAFRGQMSAGDFVWVDGHVCLNDSQYLRREKNGACLTPWANAHVDACCLRFGREYLKGRESVLLFGRLNSSEEYNRQYNEYLDRRMSLTSRQRAEKRDRLMRSLPNAFCDALRYLMENRDGGKITIEELAAAAQVSRKTIERYRKEDQRAYQEDKVIAICIALHLPPWLSRTLLDKARITVRNHGPRGYYGEILDCCFMDSVGDVQRYLEENGYPKLNLQDS